MTEQTKKFIDENPGWLHKSYATNKLQEGLERVLSKFLFEGYVVDNTFKRTKNEVLCTQCGAKLLRSKNQRNRQFVCLIHKQERVNKYYIPVAHRKPVV